MFSGSSDPCYYCVSGLKVREHNVLGPYVDGLSQVTRFRPRYKIGRKTGYLCLLPSVGGDFLPRDWGSHDRGQQKPDRGLHQYEQRVFQVWKSFLIFENMDHWTKRFWLPSRSHAVFTVILTQTLTDTQSGVSGEKVSRWVKTPWFFKGILVQCAKLSHPWLSKES